MDSKPLDLQLLNFRNEATLELALSLAPALAAAGRDAEALEVCEVGLSRFGDQAPLLLLSGQLWTQRGQLKLAQALLQRALIAERHYASAYRALADVLAERGEVDRAHSLMQRAAALLPPSVDLNASLRKPSRTQMDPVPSPFTEADTSQTEAPVVASPTEFAAEETEVSEVTSIFIESDVDEDDDDVPTQMRPDLLGAVTTPSVTLPEPSDTVRAPLAPPAGTSPAARPSVFPAHAQRRVATKAPPPPPASGVARFSSRPPSTALSPMAPAPTVVSAPQSSLAPLEVDAIEDAELSSPEIDPSRPIHLQGVEQAAEPESDEPESLDRSVKAAVQSVPTAQRRGGRGLAIAFVTLAGILALGVWYAPEWVARQVSESQRRWMGAPGSALVLPGYIASLPAPLRKWIPSVDHAEFVAAAFEALAGPSELQPSERVRLRRLATRAGGATASLGRTLEGVLEGTVVERPALRPAEDMDEAGTLLRLRLELERTHAAVDFTALTDTPLRRGLERLATLRRVGCAGIAGRKPLEVQGDTSLAIELRALGQLCDGASNLAAESKGFVATLATLSKEDAEALPRYAEHWQKRPLALQLAAQLASAAQLEATGLKDEGLTTPQRNWRMGRAVERGALDWAERLAQPVPEQSLSDEDAVVRDGLRMRAGLLLAERPQGADVLRIPASLRNLVGTRSWVSPADSAAEVPPYLERLAAHWAETASCKPADLRPARSVEAAVWQLRARALCNDHEVVGALQELSARLPARIAEALRFESQLYALLMGQTPPPASDELAQPSFRQLVPRLFSASTAEAFAKARSALLTAINDEASIAADPHRAVAAFAATWLGMPLSYARLQALDTNWPVFAPWQDGLMSLAMLFGGHADQVQARLNAKPGRWHFDLERVMRAELLLRARQPQAALAKLSELHLDDKTSALASAFARLVQGRALTELASAQPTTTATAALRQAQSSLRLATAHPLMVGDAWFFLGEALARTDAAAARDAYESYLTRLPEGSYAVRAKRSLR